DDGRPVGGTSFGIADVEDAGLDLLERTERAGCRLRDGRRRRACRAGGRRDHAELGGGERHCRGAANTAATGIEGPRGRGVGHMAVFWMGGLAGATTGCGRRARCSVRFWLV